MGKKDLNVNADRNKCHDKCHDYAGGFEEALDSVLDEMRELMISKQKDYGSKNIMEFGEYGVLVRANDKMARLKNLLQAGKEPNNESVEDSWLDLANYAVIALMVRRGIFDLPPMSDSVS